MNSKEIEAACILAKIISFSKGKECVTQLELSKLLEISQQSVSRKLNELEEIGLITKSETKNGTTVRLTNKGEELLLNCMEMIKESIETRRELKFKGKVVSGLGEGKIFLSIKYYEEQISQKMGFLPYPGTLNLTLYDRTSIENRIMLDSIPGILIPEYKFEDRVLGAVKMFPATVNSISPAAIVIPLRTVHPKSVIEVISPYFIRDKLMLKDGDEVEVIVMT
jgi:riboflavin kinase